MLIDTSKSVIDKGYFVAIIPSGHQIIGECLLLNDNKMYCRNVYCCNSDLLSFREYMIGIDTSLTIMINTLMCVSITRPDKELLEKYLDYTKAN